MGSLRVRTAGPAEAALVGALVLRSHHAAGGRPDVDFVERFVRVWSRRPAERPAFLVEDPPEHLGVVLTVVASGLPAPGGPLAAPVLLVERLCLGEPAFGAVTRAAIVTALTDHARRIGARLGPIPDELAAGQSRRA